LADLSPKSWAQLATEFLNGENNYAYSGYMTAYYKGALLVENPWETIQSLGCDIRTFTTTEYNQCMQKNFGNAEALRFVHDDRCEPSTSKSSSSSSADKHSIQQM